MKYSSIEALEARIAPASLDITGAQGSVAAGSTKTFNFPVTLTGPIASDVTVSYSTSDGASTNPAMNATAADGDFVPTSGTLTFTANGPQTQVIPVTVNGDPGAELTETFHVNLSNPTGATLTHAQALGTIQDVNTQLSISDVTVVKSSSGTSNAVFSVTLSAIPSNTPVSVDYATADGTAKAGGPFPDYTPEKGTLTFTPGGPLTKTITVPITGDVFSEPDEQFTVNLSNAMNANLPAAPGHGTIQSTGQTTVGLGVSDAQVVEGNSTNPASYTHAHFTAFLTTPAASDVTFTLTTQSGTAVSGIDFVPTTQTVTIPAGNTSAGFDVPIIGNTAFEPTKSFFVNVTNASSNVQVANAHPTGSAAEGTARGYILNDDIQQLAAGKMQWSDVDGDLVTLTVSKGTLSLQNGNVGNVTLVDSGTVGGKQLTSLDLTNPVFANATVTITASKQAGFPDATDGRVNVGQIIAASFLQSEFQVVGNDLSSVTINGDLGRITAGDNFSTPAIGKLDLYSLGAQGLSTGAPSTESDVLGPITTATIHQNLDGYLHVIGAEFGVIGTLNIGGALQGGSADNSGKVDVTGHITSAKIGQIVGGAGADSGVLLGSLNTGGVIGSVIVTGDIQGGAGVGSGKIQGTKIGNITAANLLGGNGGQAGLIDSFSTLGNLTFSGSVVGGDGASAGEIFANTGIGAVKIGGSIVGGVLDSAGSIITGVKGITSLAISGAVIGGAANNTGSVQAGGAIPIVSIGKTLTGTSLQGGGGDRSGLISGGSMTTVKLAGSLAGGTGASSGELQSSATVGALTVGQNAAGDSLAGGAGAQSGRIDITGNIASLIAVGNVRGGAGNGSGVIHSAAKIAALNLGGSLIGGDSTATAALDTSGSIQGNQLLAVTIGKNIVAGTNQGGGLANSGSIRADLIGALAVGGDVLGNTTNPVVISGSGLAGNLAIKNVAITGQAHFAEILAGYKGDATPGTGVQGFRGSPASADASIGTVMVGGSVQGLDIVAGARTGTDGFFGTGDDRLIVAGNGVKDDLKTYSQIASVILKGPVLANTHAYGIVAQYVASVKVGAAETPLPLKPGPGNDLATSDTDPAPGVEVAAGSDFRALEVPLPS